MIMPLQPIDVQQYFYHDLSHFICILFHRLFVRVQIGFKRESNKGREPSIGSLEKEVRAI